MNAFVLGNGKSRLSFDLQNLTKYGKIYGCNALYRDYIPDVLVSVDPGITQEISEADIPSKTIHWARKPTHKSSNLLEEYHHRGFSSGPIACKLASIDMCSNIFLIGFDLNSPTDTINNVYAGTEHYKSINDKPTVHSNWVRQFKRVFEDYPQTTYYRILPEHNYVPSDWEGVNNIQNISKETFYTMLNSI
jgi:hypothetical protein